MKPIKSNGIDIVIYEPASKVETFYKKEVIRD